MEPLMSPGSSRYGAGGGGARGALAGRLARWGPAALGLAAFIWLCVLSSQVNSLRDSYNHVQTSISAMAGSLAQRFSFTSAAGGPVPAGAAVSLDWAGGGAGAAQSVVAGVGSTAYLGAQRFSVPTGQQVKHTKAVAVDAELVVLVATLQAGAGVVGAAVALTPGAAADWVSGATVSLAVNDPSIAKLPFTPMDAVLLSATPLNAGGVAATLLLVSGGSACVLTATRVSAGGPVAFSTSQSALYSPNIVQDVQAAPLSATSFALSYYDVNATAPSLYVLRTLAGSVAGSGPGATLTFGPPATYAPDHETHLIIPLSASQWLLVFPADDATTATDDDEAQGYPLSVAVAGLAAPGTASLGLSLWGAAGQVASPGLVPPVPWTARYVHAHGYFHGVALGVQAGVAAARMRGAAASAGAASSASALLAFADAGLGDALRALVVTVFTSGSSVDVVFGDSLPATPKGALGRYRSFVAAAFAPVGSAQDVALVTADIGGGGGVATALVRVSGPLLTLDVVLRAPLPAYALPPGSDPAGMKDYGWIAAATIPAPAAAAASRPASLAIATLVSLDGSTSLGNLTLVERRHHPAGIALGAAAGAGASLAVTAGYVNAGVTGGAWVGPLPAAGSPVFATSRGSLLGAASAQSACVPPLDALPSGPASCVAQADLVVAPDEASIGFAADGGGSLIFVPQQPGVAHVGGAVGQA